MSINEQLGGKYSQLNKEVDIRQINTLYVP